MENIFRWHSDAVARRLEEQRLVCLFQPPLRWTQKAHHVCPEKCSQISFSVFSRIDLHIDCLHPHRGASSLEVALQSDLHNLYSRLLLSQLLFRSQRVIQQRIAIQGHEALQLWTKEWIDDNEDDDADDEAQPPHTKDSSLNRWGLSNNHKVKKVKRSKNDTWDWIYVCL